MRILRRFLARLVASITRSGDEARLNEEVEEHLALQTNENIGAGLSSEEARRQAILKFGAVQVVKEHYRDQRRLPFLEQSFQDVRYALRSLRKNPSFAAVTVLTLGLGIGANIGIFSVIDAALLRPFPYPQPDRMVQIRIESREPDGRVFRISPSQEDVSDWQHAQVFSHLAVWRVEMQRPVLDGLVPERVQVRLITDEYLSLHGVAPLMGRSVQTDDLLEGAPAVALLGYGFWQTRFGGDRAVIGRVVRLNSEPVTLIGVLPASFYPESEIWRPLRRAGQMLPLRGTGTDVLGRLRPGVSLEQARQILTDRTMRLDDERSRSPLRAAGVDVQSLYDTTTRGYGDTTKILGAAVGLILLIACVNVAGLLLARGTARGPELAIRTAIGAGRGRLIRQLLTESLVLSAIGGLIGILLAFVSLDLLVTNIPLSLPDNSPVEVNWRALAFALMLSIATGVAFGLVPAFNFSRVSVRDALMHVGRTHGSALSQRGGQLVIALEVSLAVLLLVGAGLMIRSFVRIHHVGLGFDPDTFTTMDVVPVDPNEAALKDYYPALLGRLRNLPAIQAVGAIDHLPLDASTMKTSVKVRDKQAFPSIHQFLPGFFEAVGYSLQQGRFPNDADSRAAMPVALVNESAAKEMFPDRPAVGEFLHVGPKAPTTYQIIGVVRDVRHSGPLKASEADIYLAWGRLFRTQPLMLVVRPREATSGMDRQLREIAQAGGTRVVVERIRRGSDWFDDRIVTPRQRTILLTLLGTIGLLLAVVGIFGVTAYAVARRTHEIGVRIAFGASRGGVVREVLGDSLWPVAVGLLLGLAAASIATQVVTSFLFETPPTDPLTFALVGIALATTALVAAWIPARYAARVDPLVALRYE
jgi:predicted permease